METFSPTRTNSASILSLILSLLTVFVCCIGMVPIPFTGFICFPFGFFTGLLALITGFMGLNQISRRGETGKSFAWAGIVTGTLVILAVICVVVALVVFLHSHPGPFPLPRIFNKYQL